MHCHTAYLTFLSFLRYDQLSSKPSLQVQAAIIASLVTGRETPPCRLSIIKTVAHPSMVVDDGCQDHDCVLEGCKGNRVELVLCGQEERVKIIAPHHKTEDSQQSNGPLEVTLPMGYLSSLMMFWIKIGWNTIGNRASHNLFTSSYGKPFNDSTFCQYWQRLMKTAPPNLPYFPPNLARTSFVEEWTQSE
jgi:hypothetical protein